MREAHDTAFGKFDSPITSYLYEVSLNGGCDEEVGTVEYGPGWFGRLGKRILMEDDRGFVYSYRCSTEQDAIDAMADVAEEYARLDDDDRLASLVEQTGLGRLFA